MSDVKRFDAVDLLAAVILKAQGPDGTVVIAKDELAEIEGSYTIGIEEVDDTYVFSAFVMEADADD